MLGTIAGVKPCVTLSRDNFNSPDPVSVCYSFLNICGPVSGVAISSFSMFVRHHHQKEQ